MKRFAGSLFGGYRKQDVDEYVAFLEQELENLKAEANVRFAKQNAAINELKQKAEDADDARSKELESMVSEVMGKDKQLTELREKLVDAEKKLEEFRSQGIDPADTDIYGFITQTKKNIKDLEEKARIQATVIEKQATDKADEIRTQGRVDAETYKKEAQEEIAKGVEQVKLAKYDLYEYLVSIKKAQENLMATYESLGTILKKFPAKMEQLAMDASFELKTDKEFKWSVDAIDDAAAEDGVDAVEDIDAGTTETGHGSRETDDPGSSEVETGSPEADGADSSEYTIKL